MVLYEYVQIARFGLEQLHGMHKICISFLSRKSAKARKRWTISQMKIVRVERRIVSQIQNTSLDIVVKLPSDREMIGKQAYYNLGPKPLAFIYPRLFSNLILEFIITKDCKSTNRLIKCMKTWCIDDHISRLLSYLRMGLSKM